MNRRRRQVVAPTLFEPAETPGLITPFMFLYALHDGLVKPGLGFIELHPLASPVRRIRYKRPRPQGAKNAASGTAAACSVNGNTERPE